MPGSYHLSGVTEGSFPASSKSRVYEQIVLNGRARAHVEWRPHCASFSELQPTLGGLREVLFTGLDIYGAHLGGIFSPYDMGPG